MRACPLPWHCATSRLLSDCFCTQGWYTLKRQSWVNMSTCWNIRALVPPDPGNLIAGVLFNVAAMDTTYPVQLTHQFFMTPRLAFVICPWFMPLTMQQEIPYTLWTLVILNLKGQFTQKWTLIYFPYSWSFYTASIGPTDHKNKYWPLFIMILFCYGSTAPPPYSHFFMFHSRWVWLKGGCQFWVNSPY